MDKNEWVVVKVANGYYIVHDNEYWECKMGTEQEADTIVRLAYKGVIKPAPYKCVVVFKREVR